MSDKRRVANHTARRHDRPRPAPRPGKRQAERGENEMTPEGQRERAEDKQTERIPHADPKAFEAKKRDGARFSSPHPRLPTLLDGHRFERDTDNALDMGFRGLFSLEAVLVEAAVRIHNCRGPSRTILAEIHDAIDEAVVIFVLV